MIDMFFFTSVLVSSEMVIFKSGDFNEKVYVRENGATIPASINQILSMGKRRLGIDGTLLDIQYEKSIFKEYNHLSRMFRAEGKEPSEEILISKEVLGKDGRITQGFQMFSDNYDLDDTLVCCKLWNGFNKGVDTVLDKKDFSGSIRKIIIDVFDFIKRNTKNGFIKKGWI